MPIIPRREIPQGEIPTLPTMTAPPVDTTVPQVLAAASKITLDLAQGYSRVEAKRQAVEDATEMAKRVLLAETDVDKVVDNIRRTRETHPKAPDHFQQAINEISGNWTKGLREDLAAQLTRHMTPRVIQGLKSAREIKNTYLIDDAQATLNATEQAMIDQAGRLDVSDERAFDRVATYSTYVKTLVDATLLKAEEGEKRLRETPNAMAYRRVQRMAISDNPAIVEQAIGLLDREENERGSTFASVLSAEHRNNLRKAAEGQRETLKQRAQEDADRADRLSRQRQKDIDDEAKARDLGAIGVLTLGIMRGEQGFEELNQAVIYNHELSVDPIRQEHLYNLIEKRGQEGSTNWTLYNQVWTTIQRSRGSVDVTALVLPYAGKVNGLAVKDADKLIETGRKAAEFTIYKDDFFQAGQKDIDRNLMPPVGVIDEAKHRRYAEASREFFDRATPLIQAGKRSELPTLAREIADRYLKQTTKIAEPIAPKHYARYPSKEDTVRAWEAQYGADPKKWSPAARAEFNRQIWLHDQLGTDELPISESARDTKQSKKPSKLPNPIK